MVNVIELKVSRSEMMGRLRPGTVLGTMEFGRGPCTGSVPREMTEAFLNFDPSYQHLDTALMYSGGKSESLLGEMACWREKGGLIDDKINPWDKKNFGEESIRSQVETCLARLKSPSVEVTDLSCSVPSSVCLFSGSLSPRARP